MWYLKNETKSFIYSIRPRFQFSACACKARVGGYVMAAKYDTIGLNYAQLRRPDPRIAAAIERALGNAQKIVNVGAGAGSYEPEGRDVTALEPSAEMIAQRPEGHGVVVQGVAEALPFETDSFDAAMAVLTVHHWSDQRKGLSEMRRVSRGPIVILTYDPAFRGFWLADYIPELVTLDERQMPAMQLYERVLGPVEVQNIEIPHDCIDGFLCAYWRRPSAYLDARVRASISSFWAIKGIGDALGRLKDDLHSGAWAAKYGALMDAQSRDFGYRLVVAR
jgi:SAM-dependent methyltransferase